MSPTGSLQGSVPVHFGRNGSIGLYTDHRPKLDKDLLGRSLYIKRVGKTTGTGFLLGLCHTFCVVLYKGIFLSQGSLNLERKKQRTKGDPFRYFENTFFYIESQWYRCDDV